MEELSGLEPLLKNLTVGSLLVTFILLLWQHHKKEVAYYRKREDGRLEKRQDLILAVLEDLAPDLVAKHEKRIKVPSAESGG